MWMCSITDNNIFCLEDMPMLTRELVLIFYSKLRFLFYLEDALQKKDKGIKGETLELRYFNSNKDG